MDDAMFMDEALALAAEAAAEGEVPVGCVIVRNGEIVGRGRNRREKDKTALGHGEIEAIGQACRTLGGWRLWECTLYVTLEPCPMCAGAIINARIPRVVYGASDTKMRPGVDRIFRQFKSGIADKAQVETAGIKRDVRRDAPHKLFYRGLPFFDV